MAKNKKEMGFLKSMPKIELHAHLNGSLTSDVLMELGNQIYGETSPEFQLLCNSFRIDDTDHLQGCFKRFRIAHDLTTTEKGLRLATDYVIRDFSADNVIYLELRTTPKETPSMSREDYLKCVLEAIRESKTKYPKIMVKLLPSIDRSQGVLSARHTLNIVKRMMVVKEYTEIIKGIDLSGDPTKGDFNSIKVVLEEARHKLRLKLALHCGEVENENEIRDMLNFGMDRCGHGTFIKGSNLELLRKKLIPVECCISSNVKCKTTASVQEHHFGKLFEMGHPVVICTDDFGVFNTSLSNELAIVQQNFNLTPLDLKKLTTTAIDASFAEEHEKDVLRESISQYF